jgi:hypothetical protein
VNRFLFLIALAGCGDSECSVDTDCTPAASCGDGTCSCPAAFMPPAPMFISQIVRADVAQLPGLTAAAGLIDDADKKLHALLVAFDPMTVPIDTDIDLATADPTVVRIGLGYEVDPLNTIRGGYLVTSGMVRFSRACADGVEGVLTGVSSIEVDIFAGFAPIEGGCTFASPSIAFHIGDCP